MLRSALATLRQPRYAMLSALMLLVAIVCVLAGSWQIARFEGKVHANDALRANARDAVAPVASVLPVLGHGTVNADAAQFRAVRATGHYDGAAQTLVTGRSVGGHNGFLVVTPLVTPRATLLVVRGFVAETPAGNAPADVAAAPSGTVTVVGRAQPGETTGDAAAQLPPGEVRSINPADQAGRLGRPLYDGFVELDAGMPGQPGQAGLVAVPAPSLSNPAGGAVEPQHFAYIIQWYLFAVLALIAPFAMARADRRERDRTDAARTVPVPDGPPPVPDAEAAAAPAAVAAPDPDELRARKLADRYR